MEDERLSILKIVVDSRTATAGTRTYFQMHLPETVMLPKHLAVTSQTSNALTAGGLYTATRLWESKITISTSSNG